MHVTLPYDNDPATRILFDEPYTNESLPQAVEMAGGLVFFNSEPFIGYDDKPTRLEAPEAGALALTSVGMNTEQTVDRLDRQFDCGSAPLESMYAKLDVAGRQAGIMAVAAAFNKGVYLPERAPDLTSLRSAYQEPFLALTAELAAGKNAKEIGTKLGFETKTIHAWQQYMAADLGLAHVKRKGAALVMLAGASEFLPGQEEVHDMNPFGHPPEKFTHTIFYTPTKDSPFVIAFRNQPDQAEPEMRVGYADRVYTQGAIIKVNDVPFLDYAGEETQLMPIEMAALLLRCVLSRDEVLKRTGANTGKRGGVVHLGPLLRAYDKLLPPAEGPPRFRAIERSIRSAFEKRLFTAENPPDRPKIEQPWRDRVFPLGRGMAEGKKLADLGEDLGLSQGGASLSLDHIKERLKLSNAGLALISEADRWFRRDRPRAAREAKKS